MSGFKKYHTAVACTLIIGCTAIPALSLAAVDDTDTDMATPAFTDPSRALQAANRAQQAAAGDTSLGTALQDVERSQTALDDALASNNQQAIQNARASMTRAEKRYTSTLNHVSGVSDSDITAMHDAGMGWEDIAHELGVQHGLDNREHSSNRQNHYGSKGAAPGMHGIDQQELDEATARNMESGWSKGHGVGIQAGVHDPGTGLSSTMTANHWAGRNDDHDFDGISGAGGLGHGGNTGGSTTGSGMGGDHDGTGGTAGSSGGPGSSGGRSGSSDHGAAGTDGSPGGNSGGTGSSGGASSAGSSSGMGGSSSSGGHGGSSGHDGGSSGRDH
jgi:hypothetical protein